MFVFQYSDILFLNARKTFSPALKFFLLLYVVCFMLCWMFSRKTITKYMYKRWKTCVSLNQLINLLNNINNNKVHNNLFYSNQKHNLTSSIFRSWWKFRSIHDFDQFDKHLRKLLIQRMWWIKLFHLKSKIIIILMNFN